MFSRIWLINILLALVFVLFGLKSYGVWQKNEKIVTENQKSEKPKPRHGKKNIKNRRPPESNYQVIVDKNLFSADRTEYIPEAPETEDEAKMVRVSGKQVILYGVVITDNYKSALISNPVKERGERNTKWVKVRDMVGDLAVTEIRKESIFLTEGEENYEILLYDKNKPKRAAKVLKEQKPNIVTTGSENKSSKPTMIKKKKTSKDKYNVIKTPFGDVRRRKKE